MWSAVMMGVALVLVLLPVSVAALLSVVVPRWLMAITAALQTVSSALVAVMVAVMVVAAALTTRLL
jgi:hypothetical protein